MSPWRGAAWLLLYLGAALSLLVETGLLGRARAPDLARLPQRLGPFAVEDEIAFDASALGAQPPERYAFRRLRTPEGVEGRIFVAYYERAQRWSGRPHDVQRCFAAAGWEERDSRRIEGESHRPWSRRFERAGSEPGASDAIRVVHWIERPGSDADRLAPAELLARLASGRGFRPDVASVYFELPANVAVGDDAWRAAVAELSAFLEAAWR